MKKPDETGNPLVDWAVSRWNAEVKERPLVNVYRRMLDSTWRQVIRWAGADPDKLLGPAPDNMVDTLFEYHVGEQTMARVFRANGITNLHDLQAVLNAVEEALCPQYSTGVYIDANLFEGAIREIREWKVDKGGDDQIVLNLEAGFRAYRAGWAPPPGFNRDELEEMLDIFSQEEQTVDTGEGRIESTEGFWTRLLRAVLAGAPPKENETEKK